MDDSTNPRVMADNIKTLDARTLGTAAEVKALQTYSTDEIDTGKKWIDGSPIYSIVITTKTPEAATDGTYVSKAIEFNDLPISFSGVAWSSTQRIPIPYKNNGENGIKVSWTATNGLILYSKATGFNNFDCAICIEYIKAPVGLLAPNPNDNNRNIETPETPGEENKEEK